MKRTSRAGFCLLLIMITGCVCPCGDQPRFAQLGRSFKNLTNDGAWCWFADPRVVYYEADHTRTYIGCVNKQGDINISYYDHETKK